MITIHREEIKIPSGIFEVIILDEECEDFRYDNI
jgi:hypothetical protein